TEGDRGALSYNGREGFVDCPAFSARVVDKIGAGDSLFAITSLCYAVGMPTDLTLLIGNLAAAGVVATIGNSKSVNKVELLKALDTVLK
ncbi:PfkB family carbohydrate kinase, partial [Chloroflexota bacterium]